ncbi:MAG: putative RNA methyltransferase [Chloroflexota bacterium]
MEQKTPAYAPASPFAGLPPILRCPDCAGALEAVGRTLICPVGHSFDLAREGYVNLARSRRTGDSKEMLRARRRFLEAGHYQPLSDLMNHLVGEHCPAAPFTVLDAGCGEGYYLGRLAEHLAIARRPPADAGSSRSESHGSWAPDPLTQSSKISLDFHALGLDAAKDAARMAAARYRDGAFVVADLAERLPLGDEAIGVLLNVFAPRNASEFHRVLRPDGLLLSVIPTPDHLRELGSMIPMLGIEERKEEQVRAALRDEFLPLGTERLSYIMNLSAQSLADLVEMTPSARHLDSAARARLGRLGAMPSAVTASFLVLSFRRRYTLIDSSPR